MAWNKDRQIKADVSVFRSIFPEQTKTPIHIVIWSIILLADIMFCVLGALFLGIINLENFSKWTIALVLVTSVALFWLQGIIFGAIAKLFKRN